MPISIYPPILKSTQKPFQSGIAEYRIYFTLQSITNFSLDNIAGSDFKHIQIRVVQQSNNKTIVDTSKYPDGIIYKPASYISTNVKTGQYYISIMSADIGQAWRAGDAYKVQLRLGKNEIYTDIANFASWKQEQIETGAFSEWSTVMIIKAISTTQDDVNILNDDIVRVDIVASQRTEGSLTPLFRGMTSFDPINKEIIEKYRFDLYQGRIQTAKDPEELRELNESILLETSNWLTHNNNNSGIDDHRFKTVLTEDEIYTVVYSVKTLNGFEDHSEPYVFSPVITYLSQPKGLSLIVESDTAYCKENGCINIYCTSTEPLQGNYVLTRASEKSNFSVWEDITYLMYFNTVVNDKLLIYQDFTIESGIKYKYAIQIENFSKQRTEPLYQENNPYHVVNFEYCYLYRDGIQVRLQFNQQMSSFKHTVLRAKQDTLGDRYPHLVQNGNAYYAEFPVSGLISLHMDDDRTFFELREDGYYYKGNLVIPKDKLTFAAIKRDDEEQEVAFDHNLIDDNIFVERVFREKVEEFLNEFNYKLYKSPTEGNIIVGLMNVNLQPNQTLGRMIYSFNATAYEVIENTLENLNTFGIIDIGEFSEVLNHDTSLSFGQVSGIYGNNVDVYELVRKQEEVSAGGEYKKAVKQIKSIWVEYYPQLDFTAELLELDALKTFTEDPEEIAELDAKIQEYVGLQNALSGPLMTSTILNINGSNVLIQPNKVYKVEENISTLTVIAAIAPVIINYICEVEYIRDETAKVVSGIDSARIWNQISGVFTGTDSILREYRFDYLESKGYRVFNDNPDASIVYYKGDIISDNTTFNLYKDVNILDIIKEDARQQVEFIYDTEFNLVNGEYTDGAIYYEFNRLTMFDIEADEGTIIILSKNADGSDPLEVRIGAPNRYILYETDDIEYIALKEPQFCIINYKCLTSQTKMAGTGGSNV